MKDFFNPRLKRTITPAKEKKGLIFYNPGKTRRAIFGLGSGLFLIGLIYLIYLYTPLTKEFLVYSWLTYFRSEQLDRQAEVALVSPAPMEPTPTLPPNPDENFSIIIPKINAQAKVVADVNPVERDIYQVSLKEGVAHAAGTAHPGEGDTIYLFAHSTNGQWNVVRYNAVFFLLNHLEADDEIWMVYHRRLYPYLVVDKKIVEADEVSYLNSYHDGETLILQTCWPPGTILKRLLVFAKPKEG